MNERLFVALAKVSLCASRHACFRISTLCDRLFHLGHYENFMID